MIGLAEWVKVVSSGVLATEACARVSPKPLCPLSPRLRAHWMGAGSRSVQPPLVRKKRGVPPESGDTYSDQVGNRWQAWA